MTSEENYSYHRNSCFFLVGIAIVRDQIIKSVITAAATEIMGAPLHIDGFSLSIFKQSIRISGLRMYNPAGFSGEILIDLPKVAVDYDLSSIIKGRLHLYRVDVKLKVVDLEKNKEGKLNVDSLKFVKQREVKEPKEKKTAKSMPMQIDLLNLEIGKVVYRDYSYGKEQQVRAYDVNLKKSYKNITSAKQLAVLIVTEPMKHAGIKGAEIYGVALLTGAGVIPITIVSKFTSKDSFQQDFDVEFHNLYDVSLDVLKRLGKINKQNSSKGIIVAQADGADVTVRLKQLSSKSTQITVSARKYLLPRPETANGILYQISEQLK